MGAWGVGPLDCDGALDWLEDLLKTSAEGRRSVVRDALEVNEFPSVNDSEASLAAAELVATCKGWPLAEIAPEMAPLLVSELEVLDFGDLALRALRRVERGEMSDLWFEPYVRVEWRRALAGLRARLARPVNSERRNVILLRSQVIAGEVSDRLQAVIEVLPVAVGQRLRVPTADSVGLVALPCKGGMGPFVVFSYPKRSLDSRSDVAIARRIVDVEIRDLELGIEIAEQGVVPTWLKKIFLLGKDTIIEHANDGSSAMEVVSVLEVLSGVRDVSECQALFPEMLLLNPGAWPIGG